MQFICVLFLGGNLKMKNLSKIFLGEMELWFNRFLDLKRPQRSTIIEIGLVLFWPKINLV
jgi:hypothetical protein